MPPLFDMVLSMPVSAVIRKHLINEGVILAEPNARMAKTDWPSTFDFMPDAPDRIVTVYYGIGLMETALLSDGSPVQHPSIQILVRDASSSVAHAKASAITNVLLEDSEGLMRQNALLVDMGASYDTQFRIHSVLATSGIIPLGHSGLGGNLSQNAARVPKEIAKNELSLVSLNFRVTITEEDK